MGSATEHPAQPSVVSRLVQEMTDETQEIYLENEKDEACNQPECLMAFFACLFLFSRAYHRL